MAIWEKLFSKITFKDYPDTSTPINADNLNKMTDAIDGIDGRVVELNSNLSALPSIKKIRVSGTRNTTYTNLIQVGVAGVTSDSIVAVTPKTAMPGYISRVVTANNVIQVVCNSAYTADTEYTFDVVIFN